MRKVKLGNEVRESLVLASGSTVSRPVTIGPHAVLSFALGKATENVVDLRFTLDFRAEGESATPLLETDLPADAREEWIDHVLSLRDLEGKTGRLEARATVVGGEVGKSGFAFWGNPVLFEGSANGRRPNIILLSVDTLGASHLTAYGAPGTADDFFTGMARHGVLFTNSFSSSTLTHVSHGSLLTGKAPLNGNLFWLAGDTIEDTTLAEVLRAHGYLTAAFTGGVLVTESLGFDRGFDSFYQADTLLKNPMEETDIRDVLRRADEWLADRPSPWFLFLHSYEVHTPYYAHPALTPRQYFNVAHMKGANPMPVAEVGKYLQVLDALHNVKTREAEVIRPEEIARLRDAYLGEIRFLNGALRDFFSVLRDRGQLDHTVVVVTADHGEAFFEHGLLEHGLLYDENLRVPLIFSAPGRLPEGVAVADAVNALDVAPTILELAGIPKEEGFEGRSLVGAMRGEAAGLRTSMPSCPATASPSRVLQGRS